MGLVSRGCVWCSVMDLERYDLPDDLGPRPKLDPADEILLQVRGTGMEPLLLQLFLGHQLACKGQPVTRGPECRSCCTWNL